MASLERDRGISTAELIAELDRLALTNPSAGLDLGLAALECLADAGEEFLADLHRLIAVCAHYAQRYEHALIHSSEASRRFSKLGNDAFVVRSEMIMAVAEAGLGLQVRGIQRIQAAIQLAASANLDEMEALAWGNLSHLYWQVERYDLARDCTAKAISMTDEKKNARRAGIMHNNMAELCCRLRDPETALKHVMKSRELLQGDDSSAYLANQAETESQIHEHRGELGEASACLHSAIRYARMAGSVRQEITYSERLGRVECRRGRMDEALRALVHAKSISQAMDFPHRLDEICEALGTVYEQQGRLNEAMAELRTALQFRTEKAKREFDETLRSLESAHRMDLAQREAAILREKNRELQASEERYALAAKGSAHGIWDLDVVNAHCSFSSRYREMLGFGSDDPFLGMEDVIGRIHPEDGFTNIADVLMYVHNDRLSKEVRILHRDGTYRWFHISGIVVWDEGGNPIRMVGSLSDVSERKANERAMREAKERAEEANRHKSEFLANMSHEIRTPMNGVLGLTDVLLDTPLEASQREHLLTIQHCGKTLLAIINDVLDLSKIEAGKFDLEIGSVDLRRALLASLPLYEQQAHSKGLEFHLRLGDDPIWVRADEVRINQVVANLVSNAIKFTESGRVEVWLEAEDLGEEVDLKFGVMDTGIGIPPDRLEAIFESFVQADGSTTRRFGGTGLGLTIGRRLTELMGGRLEVHSVVGSGSVFSLTLRLPKAHSPRIRVEAPRDVTTVRRRVLVAEDNPVNQLVAMRQLQRIGCEVTLVKDGREAVDRVMSEPFDLVLMDLQMPVLDGLSAARMIREAEVGLRTPIVALTANAYEEHRRESFEAGMDGHISKPFKLEDLERVLAEFAGPRAA
jgi:PAS domain S-box-containing protein